ncbi:GNAT family N-acetyltransferase [Naumannella halotolerans]|uniref:Ribosomal-protein-alanine N-acetyltransferase n=1 Tax=Naumannella halotolerans TaxID=993414 RepID=A0A4R7J555_9ACTN|nr:GNAT family protein [Naumannella halotolerans]TDT32471.1 ribosomal-protein-alanine N-acetyltransferase [Naumannella halotolerans]
MPSVRSPAKIMSSEARFPDHHHWPVSLRHGSVRLDPLRRSDRREWNEVRGRNFGWLLAWEPTVPPGGDNRPGSFTELVRTMNAQARHDATLPWVIRYTHGSDQPVLAGQLTVNNIIGGAAMTGSIGYWVDERWAGRGIVPTAVALAMDYCFSVMRLHRIEVAIRPENGRSLRVVEKLGFRSEGLRPRYLHINGQWRDHLIFALHADELSGPMLSRVGDTPRRLA